MRQKYHVIPLLAFLQYITVAIFFLASGKVINQFRYVVGRDGRWPGFAILVGLGVWFSVSLWDLLLRDKAKPGTWSMAFLTHSILFSCSAYCADPPYIFELHNMFFQFVLSMLSFALLRSVYYAVRDSEKFSGFLRRYFYPLAVLPLTVALLFSLPITTKTVVTDPVKLGLTQPQVKWSYTTMQNLGERHIIGDTLYFASRLEQTGNDPPPAYFNALDLRTGKLKWQFMLARDPYYMVPVEHGDLVLFAEDHFTIYGVEKTTGKEVWHIALSFENWINGSPFIHAGVLYYRVGDEWRYADPATGKAVAKPEEMPWSAAPKDVRYIVQDGVDYYFSQEPESSDTTLIAADYVTGEELWRFDGSSMLTSLCLNEDAAIIGVISTQFENIIVDGESQTVNRYSVIALAAATGEKLWEYTADRDKYIMDLAVDGDKAVIFKYPSLYVLDIKTGGLVWQKTLSEHSFPYWAARDGILYVHGDSDAGVSLQAVETSTGQVRWVSDITGIMNYLVLDASGDLYGALWHTYDEETGPASYLYVLDGKTGKQKHKVKLSPVSFSISKYGEDLLLFCQEGKRSTIRLISVK